MRLILAMVFIEFVSVVQGDLSTVVDSLEALLKESQKQTEDDTAQRGKEQCTCDTEQNNFNKVIEENTNKENTNVADLTKALGFSQNASIEIHKAQESLEKHETDKSAEEKAEGDAVVEYTARIEELDGQMKQLGNAISTLSGAASDISTANEEDVYGSAPNPVSFLSSQVKQKLRGPYGEYSSQNPEILGILGNMKDNFSQEKTEMDRQRADDKNASEQSIKAHNDAIELANSNIEDYSEILSDNQEKVRTARENIEGAKEQIRNSTDGLNESHLRCKEQARSFEAKRENQVSEQKALAIAIKILDSDDSFKNFNRKRADRNFDVDSFVQISSILSSKKQFNSTVEGILKSIDKAITVIEDEETYDTDTEKQCRDDQADIDSRKEKSTNDESEEQTKKTKNESNVADAKKDSDIALAAIKDDEENIANTKQAAAEQIEANNNEISADKRKIEILQTAITVLTDHFNANMERVDAEAKRTETGKIIIQKLEKAKGNAEAEVTNGEKYVEDVEKTSKDQIENWNEAIQENKEIVNNKASIIASKGQDIVENNKNILSFKNEHKLAVEQWDGMKVDCEFLFKHLTTRRDQRKKEKLELENTAKTIKDWSADEENAFISL